MKNKLLLLTLLVTNVFAASSSQFIPEQLSNSENVLVGVQILLVKTNQQGINWDQLLDKQGIKPEAQSFIVSNLTPIKHMGKSQEIFNASATTINDITLPLEVRHEIPYVSSTSVTQNPKGTYQTIEAGMVKPGFNISITPLVDKNGITINSKFSMTLLNHMSNIKSGDQVVQLPNISNCDMEQKATLKSGETFVVSACDVNYDSFNKQFAGESNVTAAHSSYDAKIVYLITPTLWKKSKG